MRIDAHVNLMSAKGAKEQWDKITKEMAIVIEAQNEND